MTGLSLTSPPLVPPPPPSINGEVLEMTFSAPSEELSEADIDLILSVLEKRLDTR